MDKSTKKNIFLIPLSTALITGIVVSISAITYKIWVFLPLILVPLSVIVVYVIGIFIGRKKGIKDIFNIMCLGLLICIFDLMLVGLLFLVHNLILGKIISWEFSMYLGGIAIMVIYVSGFLAIGHMLIIFILLLVKKMEEKSK